MIVTIYADARSPSAADAQEMTWDDLASTLEVEANRLTAAPVTADLEEQKRKMLAWSPVALRVPYRLEANADAVTALVLDVDGGATPDAIASRLHANGWAGLLYESASSTDAHPKFRVVSPIAAPIAPDDSRATRFAFAEALGLGPGCGVERAVEAVKLFFVGRAHDTRERGVWRVDGQAVDVAALPAPRAAWKVAAPSAAMAAHLADLPPANAGIAAALGPWTEHAGRKWDLCGAVAGMMRRMAYGPAACEAEIRAWLPSGAPGVDVDAGVRHALGAWQKPATDVSGREVLAELVGDEHGAIVCDAVERGSFVGRWRSRHPAPLVATAPGWAVAPGDRAGADALGEHARWDENDEPIPYVCPGLCIAPSDGKITIIGGLPNAAKGPTADHLAACFALGAPAFGVFDVVRPEHEVLFLDFEGFRLTKRRVRRMARALGHEPRDLIGRLDLVNMTGRVALDDRLYYRLEESKASIIVVDSYTSAMLPSGLNSDKPEFARLATMLGALGRVMIVVAHAKKMPEDRQRPTLSDIAGSGALGAMAATALSLWKPSPDTNDNLVRIACARAPETAFGAFAIEFADQLDGGLAVRHLADGAADENPAVARAAELGLKAARVVSFLRACGPRPQSTNAIHDNVGLRTELIGEIVSALREAGIVQYEPSSGTKGMYTLIDAQGPEFDVTFDLEGRATKKTRDVAGASVGGFRRP